MIKIFRRTIKDKGLKELESIEIGSWIHVHKPTTDEIKRISEVAKIDRDNLWDSLDENEVPRIEKENGSIIVYTRVPLSKNDEINTTPLTIIITPSHFITITVKENKVIDTFINNEAQFFTTQKAKFLLEIFSVTVKRFNKHINAINKRIVSKKGKLKYLRNDDIVNLVETEEDLNDFISSLAPDINVFERVLSGKYVKLFETDQDLIEDLLIDARQVLDLCKTNVKRINNIREAYSTILSNNLNKTMKFLASITVIFTIPTIVGSVYGMNVALPFANNPQIFFFLMGFTVLMSMGVLALFFWKRWL
jgi:magnesium transporter